MYVNEPTENIYPVGAAIGPGMTLAIGAQLPVRKKTIAMCGDGGLCVIFQICGLLLKQIAMLCF